MLARNVPERPIRVIVTSIVLFCFSLLLTAYSSKNPAIAQVGSAVLHEIILPVQLLTNRTVHSVVGIWQNYISLMGVRDENRGLRARQGELEAERIKLLEYRYENERLLKLLGAVQERGLSGIQARVVGYNPSNWVRTITIDRGMTDRIENGQAVIGELGLVGKVVKASGNSAEILLITDHASGVDAIVQRTRARGVVSGLSHDLCRILYVQDNEDLEKGDMIVTSGVDGIYPKGVAVGTVTRFSHAGRGRFQNVEITPVVDFSQLENVFVVNRTSPTQGEKGGAKK